MKKPTQQQWESIYKCLFEAMLQACDNLGQEAKELSFVSDIDYKQTVSSTTISKNNNVKIAA